LNHFRKMTIILFCSGIITAQIYGDSIAPDIDAIVKKYQRGPANLNTSEKKKENEVIPLTPLQREKKKARKFYVKTQLDSVAKIVRDNFYPELSGIQLSLNGDSEEPATLSELKMASRLLREAWDRSQAIQEGGTKPAGKAMAQLIKKFAGRRDIYIVSTDTETTPLQELRGDIGKMREDLNYRFDWAINKLSEFRNPENVQWTPTAHFQLGPYNQNFIRGFMEIQFKGKRKPKKKPTRTTAYIIGPDIR